MNCALRRENSLAARLDVERLHASATQRKHFAVGGAGRAGGAAGRFEQRLDDPARQWKISGSDYSERALWDDYIDAFEGALYELLDQTCALVRDPVEPQMVRNLAVSQIIADALDDMNLKTPKPTVDLQEIRRQYHAAAAKENGANKNKEEKASPAG